MLGSQLHPESPSLIWQISLVWQIAIPRSLILLIILHIINGANAQQLQNITVPVTSSQITYTPFVCNASTELADPQPCAGAWQSSNSNETISTTGPTSTSGNIIPQLFFEFKGSFLYLTTASSSNASVNLSISAGGKNISTVFDSSLGIVSIIGLPPNQITLLTVTYIPASGPTLFSLDSLIITVPKDTPTNSFFPTPTLPPLGSLPATLSSSSGASATAVSTTASNKTKVAQAVGITLGLGVGLTALAVAAFYYWKRRKRRSEAIGIRIEEAKSEWSKESFRISRFSRFSHFRT